MSRAGSPGPTESVFSQDDALTQLEGDRGTSLDGRRPGSVSSSYAQGPQDPNVASLSQPWYDSVDTSRRPFHALSTVLSHPTKKPAPLRPSRVPLPPAPPTEPLPEPNKKDIDLYLKLISPEWARFERGRRRREGLAAEAGDDASSAGGGTGVAQAQEAGEDGERLMLPAVNAKDLLPLRLVPDVFFEADFNLANPRTFDVVTEQMARGPAQSSSFPMSPTRSGQSSRMDSPLPTLNPLPDSVQPLLPPSNPASPTTARPLPPLSPPPLVQTDVTHTQNLQDRLAQHLDVVEQHLVVEISKRSSSFFAALTNLQDLNTESTNCLSRIASLKQELLALDRGQAQKGLEALRLHRSLRGLKRVDTAIRDILGVEEALGMIKGLVANGDGFGAVDLWVEVDGWLKRKGKGKERADIAPSSAPPPFLEDSVLPTNGLIPPALHRNGSSSSSIRSIPSVLTTSAPSPPLASTSSSFSSPLKSKKSAPPPPDLTTAAALSHLPETLAALALGIATQLEASLQALLAAEMASASSPSAGDEAKEGLRARLEAVVLGLVKIKQSERLVDVYREVALAEVKEAFRRSLPPNVSLAFDDDPPKGKPPNGLAGVSIKAIKDLTHQDFLAIETQMFSSLLRCVQVIDNCSKTIEDILRDSADVFPDAAAYEATVPSMLSSLADVLSATAELANARASRVLVVRNEPHAALELEPFLQVFSGAWTFVVACEVICRKMIVGLRGTMVVQAKTFLQTYHSRRVSTAARLVENELWAPEETTSAQQHAVNLILEAAVSDPIELLLLPSSRSASPFNGHSNGHDTAAPSAPVGPPKKHLEIEDRSYFVVGATLGSLELLLDYIKITINVELLTTDVMSKIIEFLKSFNSRTCQVVLGAGAMRSAGLKNITAKHLALASQSLSIMVALIPYIRETLRRHLNPKQAVMLVEFDRLKRDFQEHQNEIHSKLIAIMGDRLTLHLKGLREIDFEAPSKRPGKPNEYVELLVKETAQLHKILSRYLPDQVVELITSQVFASITHGLSEAYSVIELKSEDAKARLLLDADFLTDRLAALPNSSAFPPTLLALVQDKPTPRRPTHAKMLSLLRRVSNGERPPSPHDTPGGVGDDEAGDGGQDVVYDSEKREEDGADALMGLVSPPTERSSRVPSPLVIDVSAPPREDDDEAVSELAPSSPPPTSVPLPPSAVSSPAIPPSPSLPDEEEAPPRVPDKPAAASSPSRSPSPLSRSPSRSSSHAPLSPALPPLPPPSPPPSSSEQPSHPGSATEAQDRASSDPTPDEVSSPPMPREDAQDSEKE